MNICYHHLGRMQCMSRSVCKELVKRSFNNFKFQMQMLHSLKSNRAKNTAVFYKLFLFVEPSGRLSCNQAVIY